MANKTQNITYPEQFIIRRGSMESWAKYIEDYKREHKTDEYIVPSGQLIGVKGTKEDKNYRLKLGNGIDDFYSLPYLDEVSTISYLKFKEDIITTSSATYTQRQDYHTEYIELHSDDDIKRITLQSGNYEEEIKLDFRILVSNFDEWTITIEADEEFSIDYFEYYKTQDYLRYINNYNLAINKPKINNVELIGNKTSHDLGIVDLDTVYAKEEIDNVVINLGNNFTATIDNTTYVCTFNLKHNNTVLATTELDLPLESTVVSGDYDSETKSLILTLVSGNVITIPIGDLVEGLVSTEDLEVALSDKLKKKVVQQLPTQNIDDNTVYLVPTNSSDTSITFNNGTGIYSDAVVVNNYSNFICLEVDEDSTAYAEYIIVYLYDKNNVQIGNYQYIYSNDSFNMIDVSMATTVKFMNISTDAGVPNTTTLTYKLVNDNVKDRTIKNLTNVEFNYGSVSKEIPDTDSIEYNSSLIFFKGIRVSDILGDTVTVETDELLQTPQPYVSWGYGNSEDSIISVTGPMRCDVNETTLTYTIPSDATNYDYIFFPIYDSQSSLSFRNGTLKYNIKDGVTKKKLNDLFYEKKEIDKLLSSKDNIWEDIGSVNKGMSGTSTLLDFNDIAITKPYKAFRILYYVNPSSSGTIQIRFNGSSTDSFWFGGGSTVSGKKFTEIIIEDNYMKNIDGTNKDYYATAEINRCNIYNYGQRTNFFGTCQNLPRIQDVRSIQLLIGANWTFDNTGGATVILQGIPE